MDNLYFHSHNTFQSSDLFEKTEQKPLKALVTNAIFEQSTSSIIFSTQEGSIYFFTYKKSSQDIYSPFIFRTKARAEDIVNKTIILFAYLVQIQSLLIVTKEGDILTIEQATGQTSIKAQNQQGILGASLSPVQQYLYIATKNGTLIQLDMEFDLVKEIPLDDEQNAELAGQEYSLTEEVSFTWRADAKHFCVNFPTKNGRKCLTRDPQLAVIKSPSKSDPDPQGLVQSVSEKPLEKLGSRISWQPLGGMIAGHDRKFCKQTKKDIHRIIFWQKNGLRHLQFNLFQGNSQGEKIKEIKNIQWITCRPHQYQELIAVQVIKGDSQRVLYFYHRANYHWYLKSCLNLSQKDCYFFIQENRITKLAIFRQGEGQIDIIQLSMHLSQQKWKTQSLEEDQQTRETLFYCTDGDKIQLTDFSRAVIPPPMSQLTLKFESLIRGVVKNKDLPKILVFLQNQAILYQYTCKTGKASEKRRLKIVVEWNKTILADMVLLQHSPLIKIALNKQQITQKDGILDFSQKKNAEGLQSQFYTINKGEQKLSFSVVLSNNQLKLKSVLFDTQTILSEQCTSYTFYHEFLLYTTLSNGMYEKMFIFNLTLDEFLYNGEQSCQAIRERIQNLQTNQAATQSKKQQQNLNFRSIQRGSLIASCSKGRVILQQPRGNLQTFFPKVISICSVKKFIDQGKYKAAFQLIRTNKLDLNLIIDINPDKFLASCEDYLRDIEKVDYLNLLISQMSESLSSELKYCFSKEQLETRSDEFQIKMKGSKIQTFCGEISKVLRQINREKYILSIFTSDIKRGKLEQVLFEIKDMRNNNGKQNQNEENSELPPHMQDSKQTKPKTKKKSPQEILEYVCWLVDPQVIYEASLLTYDLELSSITARCTQKDPKQYIPYLESVKALAEDGGLNISLKKKICLDLKKYDKAVIELSMGTEEHIKQALELIKKHKLFRCGLQAFCKTKDFKNVVAVKKIVIDYLLNQKKEMNQAFNMCLSIQDYKKALEIGITEMEGKKIQHVWGLLPKEERPAIQQLIQSFQETAKKSDLAILYTMCQDYQKAVKNYIKAADYKSAFQVLTKYLPMEKIFDQEIQNGFKLGHSLIRNLLIKERTLFLEKYIRLAVVQKNKLKTGNFYIGKPRENQDMYSQISASSKSNTKYTVSTTTGMRRKKDKKRDILSRNVKEGSPLEQQYLIAFVNDLKAKSQGNIKQAKILIQNLIYLNLFEEANSLKKEAKTYADIFNSKPAVKTAIQLKFEQDHPEAKQIYYIDQGKDQKEEKPKVKGNENVRGKLNIDAFDYIL